MEKKVGLLLGGCPFCRGFFKFTSTTPHTIYLSIHVLFIETGYYVQWLVVVLLHRRLFLLYQVQWYEED